MSEILSEAGRPPSHLQQMRRGTITVILSNYNHAKYLPESLTAICTQTRLPDELIVIDDGSTDNSIEIIADFARRHPFIRVIRNDGNIGLQASIRDTLPIVRTEYLNWAASDDRLLPTFIEESMALLERYPDAGMCFSELVVLQGDTGEMQRFATTPGIEHTFSLDDLPEFMTPADIVARMQRAYLPMTGNSVIVNCEKLRAIGGFRAGLEWHSDLIAYTIIALRYGACVLAKPLALLRANPGSYSHSGLSDRRRLQPVLTELLTMLREREFRDVRRLLRQTPANFSVWGTYIMRQMVAPANWDLLLPYAYWKINEYKRGHGLSWPSTIRTLTRRAFHSMWIRFPRFSKAKQLLHEKDLQTRLGSMTAERDGLANYLPTVVAERDKALAALQEIQQRQATSEAAFSRELAELVAERDRLTTNQALLLAEQEKLTAERDRLNADIVDLHTALGAITAERDGLANHLPVIIGERDATQATIAELTNQIETLEKDNASLKSIHDEFRQALEKQRLPPLLITTMPKSGTYYIAELFCRGLFIDSKIVSQQYFPDDTIRQPALRELMNGNAVNQDHFGASPINLTHIARHTGRVLVHVRDPRQALLSYIHYLGTERFQANIPETLLFIYPPLPEDFYSLDLAAKIDWGIENWLPELIRWTAGWIEAEKAGMVAIKFTRFEDMVADHTQFVHDILDFFGIQRERFVPPMLEARDATHFRRGEVDEWRRTFTPEQQIRATAQIPAELSKRFNWPLEL